jgi:hypothetical protein
MAKVKINIGGIITEMESEDVSKAIEAGELNVENEELIAYDKETFETFKKNLADSEYKNGKTAGQEMQVKDAREKLGLEFEGKSFDNLTEAYKKKILEEAKVEPSKKIEELQTDLEKMRGNYTEVQSQFDTFKQTVDKKEETSKKDSIFIKSLPKEGLNVDSDIALMVLKQKSELDLSFDDNGEVIPMKGGKAMKDEKTLKPVELSAFLSSELNSLGLIKKPSGGAGGDDDPGNGNKVSNYDKFVDEMTKNGIPPGSLKFSEEMQKRLKEKTLTI